MKRDQLARFVHTTKHLKFKQVFFRLYYICKNIGWAKEPQRRRAHQLKILPSISRFCAWESPVVLLPYLSDSGEFTFQGEVGRIDQADIWNSPHHSKLWLYNLHYFDELNRIGADSRRDLLHDYIESWVVNNPPYKGNGWEPYSLSLRLVNWIKWFSTQKTEPQWLFSLAIQADALTQQIEYHILGNHVFANGKALVFVGTYFTGKRADAWLKKGL